MSFLMLSLLVRIVVVVFLFVDKLGDQRVGVCMCVRPIVDKLVLCGHAFFLSFELLWEIHCLSLLLLVRIVVVVLSSNSLTNVWGFACAYNQLSTNSIGVGMRSPCRLSYCGKIVVCRLSALFVVVSSGCRCR